VVSVPEARRKSSNRRSLLSLFRKSSGRSSQRYTEEPSTRVNNPHIQTVATYTPQSSSPTAAAAEADAADSADDDVWLVSNLISSGLYYPHSAKGLVISGFCDFVCLSVVVVVVAVVVVEMNIIKMALSHC